MNMKAELGRVCFFLGLSGKQEAGVSQKLVSHYCDWIGMNISRDGRVMLVGDVNQLMDFCAAAGPLLARSG